MVVSESGLCRLMNRAYRCGGYCVIPLEAGKELLLSGTTWAVRIPMEDFPRRALGLVAAHAGCIPAEPVRVHSKSPNQTMIPEDAALFADKLRRYATGAKWADPLPVCFLAKMDTWSLFQERGRGAVRAFRASELGAIESDTRDDMCPMIHDGSIGIWGDGDEVVYLGAGLFQGAELAQLAALGRLRWDEVDGENADMEESSLENLTIRGFREEGVRDAED